MVSFHIFYTFLQQHHRTFVAYLTHVSIGSKNVSMFSFAVTNYRQLKE